MHTNFSDSNFVRYTLYQQQPGATYNWLFLPGGPGANSSYLNGLLDQLKLPGNSWLIDFPGSGSNYYPNLQNYDFNRWFDLFIPAIKQFQNAIIVGHSFGGMMIHLFPELENIVEGIAILNSTPKLWIEEAAKYSQQFDLPDFRSEMAEFSSNPNQETFEIALNACLPYYFPKETLEKGKQILNEAKFRYQPAVWWLNKANEINYTAQWAPEKLPTIILGGKYDCVCPFHIYEKDHRFKRDNIHFYYSTKAGHFGWVEDQKLYSNAFKALETRIDAKNNLIA